LITILTKTVPLALISLLNVQFIRAMIMAYVVTQTTPTTTILQEMFVAINQIVLIAQILAATASTKLPTFSVTVIHPLKMAEATPRLQTMAVMLVKLQLLHPPPASFKGAFT